MVTWETRVTGLRESSKHGGTPQWPQRAARPSGNSVNDVCIHLGCCVLVAWYLRSKYILAANLTLLGGKSCFPTQVSGHAGAGAPQVNPSLILADETDSQGWRSPLKAISDFFKGDPKGDTETGLNSNYWQFWLSEIYLATARIIWRREWEPMLLLLGFAWQLYVSFALALLLILPVF